MIKLNYHSFSAHCSIHAIPPFKWCSVSGSWSGCFAKFTTRITAIASLKTIAISKDQSKHPASNNNCNKYLQREGMKKF